MTETLDVDVARVEGRFAGPSDNTAAVADVAAVAAAAATVAAAAVAAAGTADVTRRGRAASWGDACDTRDAAGSTGPRGRQTAVGRQTVGDAHGTSAALVEVEPRKMHVVAQRVYPACRVTAVVVERVLWRARRRW